VEDIVLFMKRLAVVACVSCLLIGTVALANDAELAVGKTREGVLSAGKTESYFVTLEAGEFAQISVDPRGKEIVVITYEPSGGRFRGARFGPDKASAAFVAEGAGVYRVEIGGAEKSVEGTYAILLEKVVTLEARLAYTKAPVESPRIKALREALDRGNRESVGAFWKEVKEHGAPLIEPLAEDDNNWLVTFLWKGMADTRNVLVLRIPYSGGMPEDYLMKRLRETDVWYASVKIEKKMRSNYTLAPNVPRITSIAQGIDDEVIGMVAAAARPDPLNPKRWHVDKKSVDAAKYQGSSILEMPDAPAQPWIVERPGVAAGKVERAQFKSELLKNEREVAVYLPAGYSGTEKPYPVVMLFDEQAYVGDRNQTALVPTPTILDNLIAEKRIPPTVAVLVGNGPGDARSRELPCNAEFMNFLVSELLPWAHGLYNFTKDARQTVVGGSSFGGLAAVCAGLRHSETFGNVLSQSGSFWWMPAKSAHGRNLPEGESVSEPNWMVRQFIASPKLPVRFYLDAGTEEVDFSGGGNSILLTTRNLRDVLRAKGYEVHFQEFAGGHGYLSWRGTLADGLIALLGNAPEHAVGEPAASRK
jgi:enterochelin esterase family protein